MTTINKIYSEIEKEAFDKAIKLCGQKDVKDLLLVRALLAFCQVQTGKKYDAIETARKVVRCNPIDDTVIRTLVHTFKACRLEEELVPVYEHAVEFNSNTVAKDELSSELFYLFNRLGEYKKMQALATKLYKSSGKSHFLFWSICSMLLQEDLPPQMLIVGERMIAKIFNDSYSDCQPGAEEIELYIHIVSKQGKYAEALDLLDKIMKNPAGALVNENDDFVANGSRIKLSKLRLATLRGELLAALLPSRRDELISQLKHILSIYPDQWVAHEQLIDCIHKSHNTHESEPESVFDEHQKYLLDIQSANPRIRGPYLAELQFMQTICSSTNAQLPHGWVRASTTKTCHDFKAPSSQEVNAAVDTPFSDANIAFYEDFCLLLLHYIDKFQTKQCCFSDIKKYCDFIYTELPAVYTQAVISWADARSNQLYMELDSVITAHKSNPGGGEHVVDRVLSHTGEPRDKTVEVLCSYCKMNQIIYYCRVLSGENEQNVAKYTDNGIIKLHQATADLCRGGIGGDREVQPNDELLTILACASRYFYSDCSENKPQALVKWAASSLYSMNVSPFNYAFKLDLLEPLRLLAVGESALAAFSGLGAKYVQFDSMSYLIIPILMECGMYTECLHQHRCILGFHMSASRDTADMMSKCYKHCNYMKSLELRNFIRRCGSSLQLAITRAEMPIIELIEKYHTLNDVSKYLVAGGYTVDAGASIVSDQTHLESLVDNNDYNLIVSPDVRDETLASNATARRLQYYKRINMSQLLLQLLVAITNKDSISASDCFSKILVSVGDEHEMASRDLKWSQILKGFNTTSEEEMMWGLFHSLVKYYVAVIAVKVDSDAELTSIHASVTDVSVVGQQCIEEITAFKGFLLNESNIYVNIPAERKIKGAKGSGATESILFLLHPSWIRGVSKFVRILGVIVPALLQTLNGHVHPLGQKEKKKSKNKREVATPCGALQESLNQVTHHFVKLLEDVIRELEKSTDSDTLCGSNVLHVLMQWDSTSNSSVLQSSKQILADQMASSQQLTCNRLAQVLRNKITPLKEM